MRWIVYAILAVSLVTATSCDEESKTTDENDSPTSSVIESGDSGEASTPTQVKTTGQTETVGLTTGPEPQPAGAGSISEAEGIRVTLNQIVDPWTDIEAASGSRFVAFDVTLENLGAEVHEVPEIDGYEFILTDADAYAYSRNYISGVPEPGLASLPIEPGEKLRGWIWFEIGAAAALSSLQYDANSDTPGKIEFAF